jgi:hypothetical protein
MAPVSIKHEASADVLAEIALHPEAAKRPAALPGATAPGPAR